jgi:hypothetical protein
MGPSRLAIFAAAIAALAGAAQAAPYKAPRTPFGAPDLQGVWTNSALTPLQRPKSIKTLIVTDAEEAALIARFRSQPDDALDFGVPDVPIDPNGPPPPVVKDAPETDFVEMDERLGRIDGKARGSWIVDPPDGRLPFTEAGRKAVEKAKAETLDGPEGRPAAERCLTAIGSPEGPPMLNVSFNAHYRIVQTRDFVAIESEMNHDVRIIRLTGRAHLPAQLRPWMGDSVGWWEGDTLVVETIDVNPQGAFIDGLGAQFVYSPGAKITERFTRTAPDRILYEFSVDDPVTFTKVWRAQMPWRASKGPIYEYACHEGNYSLANILAGAREQEKAASAAH